MKPSETSKEFDIFGPFDGLTKCEDVAITTWGLGSVEAMWPIIEQLRKARSVHFCVGYSKQFRELQLLNLTIRDYARLGFKMHVMAGQHTKIWRITGNDRRRAYGVYVGSQNFTRCTGPNIMAKVTDAYVDTFLDSLFIDAGRWSNTTRLELSGNRMRACPGSGTISYKDLNDYEG